MARQDPIERATSGESIYEVTDWEPRSRLDAAVVYLHAVVLAGSKAAVIALGVLVTTALVGVTGFDLLTDPFVAAMIGLSVLPAVAIAAYLWRADVTTGEPATLLAGTFVLAVLFAGFAAVVNRQALPQVDALAASVGPFGAFAAYYFLVVGPAEETVKLLAVRMYPYADPRFDAVVDGAVYGAVAGLGFATIENAVYVFDAAVPAGGLQGTIRASAVGNAATLRALAAPGHVLYSAIAGYYLGLAKFTPRAAGPLVVKGLLVAALFHGAYNTLITPVVRFLVTNAGWSPITAIVVFVLAFQAVVGYYLYRKLARYRRAYRAHDAGAPEAGRRPELTEFDP